MALNQLRALGQSLWLDNITRQLLDDRTLERYCNEFSLTGLTSNPTIFDKAIRNSKTYDSAIRQKAKEGKSGEALFFELALEDLKRAAQLFLPAHAASAGVDGWVSLEVSPLLANDAAATVEQAKRLHQQADCKNLFIKIPGTAAGARAIEESIFAGIPINVTLLFSREQYVTACDAYRQGIARRIDAGLDPRVHCVASIFVSRWDKAVAGKLPPELENRLGTAICGQIYKTSLDRLASPSWQTLAEAGALPQRVLWASTGTKDPSVPLTYYVDALAAADTINTMPEKTLMALARQDAPITPMPKDGVVADRTLAAIERAGVDIAKLGTRLQEEGAEAFKNSWRDLLASIAEKVR
jgi:transaldolase